MITNTKCDDGKTTLSEFNLGDLNSLVDNEVGRKMAILLYDVKGPTEAMITATSVMVTSVLTHCRTVEQALANIDNLTAIAKEIATGVINKRTKNDKE